MELHVLKKPKLGAKILLKHGLFRLHQREMKLARLSDGIEFHQKDLFLSLVKVQFLPD